MDKKKTNKKITKEVSFKRKLKTNKKITKEVSLPVQYILPVRAIKKLNKKETFNLLDIGAGVRDIKKYLPKNINYKSLDYTDDVEHDINFNLDNDDKLPIKDNTFDIILCLETLEHLSNPQKTMDEILRISKDDATIFLSMPNEYNFWLRLQYLFGVKDEMKESFQIANKHLHIHLPRVKDIRKFFNKYLDIQEVYYGWNSYRAPQFLNKFFTKLGNIWPSVFTRVVVIKGVKHER